MVDEDPEELFEDFDEEAITELPENVDVKPVNTDLEVGKEIDANAIQRIKALNKLFLVMETPL